MSTVYRGVDLRLDRPVAIKVMDSRYAGDQQFLDRFELEAKAVARMSHPSLVAVYDQGVDLRRPFLVMELVEGGTLRDLLRERGPMPPHAAAAVLRPVLAGLAVAHRAGLIHRDIKPENVLISADGDVKLADFGLVRALAQAGITSTSVILGTAAYLSPEQVTTGDADARSDVYALGVLTYELLTGATPFDGDSALAVAYRRVDADVAPPSAAIAGVPAQFDEFVARATRRDRDQRYPDAAAMAADLDAIATELALPAFRVPTPSRPDRGTVAAPPRLSPPAAPAPVRNPTRALPRDPDEHETVRHPRAVEATAIAEDGFGFDADQRDAESDYPPAQFAGVEMSAFVWDRHRQRRNLLVAVLVVGLLTAGAALGGWTLGAHLPGLF
ncbi:protein kinase domain-containing protein [Mycolicibacterium brumae]|uniref:non-specific serine/threonine protein kinase n=1 Tax=Mycolicibacterium brumae TaxID=85968 RepID=A0A2G5P795_9MYCO|nr:serine/threonine protein kinase [Mycolicibacterium brumae]PIB74127.1 serine/threonine protein kinase [Mycolicibacterium brumae]UWW08383.1 protein kinase [Mycolicibacterium brumae]